MNTSIAARLEQQINFILEIDRLKQIMRQSYLTHSERKENDAEHSWHLAIMAILLQEYAREPIDVLRVVKMVLVHDLVEIDAGDTFCYDDAGALHKHAREVLAAERIFHLLPADQADEVRELWDEFEDGVTPEARFANALDRIEPLLLNFSTCGRSWQEHGITVERVRERNLHIVSGGAPVLGEYIQELIDEALQRGYLPSEG